MGLGKSIAIKGGAIIGAILLIAIVAKKTNILSGVQTGLANIGTSLGSGLGLGIRNAGTGFLGSFTGIGQEQAGRNFTSNFAGLADILKGQNPFDDPQVTAAYVNPNIVNDPNDPTIVPTNREFSDVVARYKTLNANRPAIPAAARATINRINSSVKSSKSSVSRSGTANRQAGGFAGTAAKRKSLTSAAKKRTKARKSGKCFNYELDMGGVGQHTYRSFGVIPLHG